MNRPTSSASTGPLARHIGLRHHPRDNDALPPPATRLQGRAAWLRLFPPDDDPAPSRREERPAGSASA